MDWVCDRKGCHSVMNVTRINKKTRLVSCPNCGNEWLIDNRDEIINDSCDNDIPECCIACGGPYPQCMTSCKIFDD